MLCAVLAFAAVMQSSRDAAARRDLGPQHEVSFAVAGDSITAGNSPDIDRGVAGDRSWAYYVDGFGLDLVGGWASPGATTAAIAKGARPIKADVLVVLAGANDVGDGVPFPTTAANLTRIVRTMGIAKVVISSIPPQHPRPQLVPAFNARLRALAGERGWTFVDASARLRTAQGLYRTGLTVDGVHPTPAGARLLGAALRSAVLDAGR